METKTTLRIAAMSNQHSLSIISVFGFHISTNFSVTRANISKIDGKQKWSIKCSESAPPIIDERQRETSEKQIRNLQQQLQEYSPNWNASVSFDTSNISMRNGIFYEFWFGVSFCMLAHMWTFSINKWHFMRHINFQRFVRVPLSLFVSLFHFFFCFFDCLFDADAQCLTTKTHRTTTGKSSEIHFGIKKSAMTLSLRTQNIYIFERDIENIKRERERKLNG